MCAFCQKEYKLPSTSGLDTTHGMCFRHAAQTLRDVGMPTAATEFLRKKSGQKDELDLSDPETLRMKTEKIVTARAKK